MRAEARVRQVPSANEARFAEIYKQYGRLVHAYCARRTRGSQAADAVAETFPVAWKKIDQVPQGESALPWLYAVAYRVLSHQWRSAARSRRLLARLNGLSEIEPPSPDLVLLRNEEHRAIVKAASRLRKVDQEILRLTFWEKPSHADAASVLGLTEGAVKQRTFRARHNLMIEYNRIYKNSGETGKGGEQ